MSATRSDASGGLRSALAAVGLTVLAVVVSTAVGVAFLVPTIALGLDVETTLGLVLLTGVGQLGFLAFGLLYARWHGLRIPFRAPSMRELAVAVAATVLALALATVFSFVLSLLDLLPGSVIEEAGTADPTFFLGIALLSIVIVAPAEELLFRGVVQGRLRESFGPFGSVVGSSLLFGSVHLANYTGSVPRVLAGILLIAVTGAVLGAIYEWTDNLAVPIVTHAAYNVALSGLAYLTL
ncbi:CPBP family intramembrane glutamic endopeptidase [Haloarchaeobius sp. HRN-SO-5]|uniref:CPBP family intramembrane glutamic endopeptidase n=1 Tax=Haloarchaeobius sp. HRN-SO-5 TaxID=3446118 RepID=UPI003EB89C78